MPIIEARYLTRQHYRLDLLRSNDFQWSQGKGCWWRLAPLNEAERLKGELEQIGIKVEVIQLPKKGE